MLNEDSPGLGVAGEIPSIPVGAVIKLSGLNGHASLLFLVNESRWTGRVRELHQSAAELTAVLQRPALLLGKRKFLGPCTS
jgi:hypothetical protein